MLLELILPAVCVCVCVWSSLSAGWVSTGHVCQSCSWSAKQRKSNFPCLHPRVRVWSRELGSAVPSPVSLLILHTQAQSGVYLRDSTPPSRFLLWLPSEPSCAIGLGRSLSGHAIGHRWRSPPKIRRNGASSPQCSSINRSYASNPMDTHWWYYNGLVHKVGLPSTIFFGLSSETKPTVRT